MALTLIQAYNGAQLADSVQKVTIAAVRQAIIVGAEGTGVTGHAARLALATKVLLSPDSYGLAFTYTVVADASATGNMSDAAIQSVVAAAWNPMAGVG